MALRTAVTLLLGVLTTHSLTMQLHMIPDEGLVTDDCEEFNGDLAHAISTKLPSHVHAACWGCVALNCVFTAIPDLEVKYSCSKMRALVESKEFWSRTYSSTIEECGANYQQSSLPSSTIEPPPTPQPAHSSSCSKTSDFIDGCAFTLALCGVGFIVGRFCTTRNPKFD